MQTFAFSLGFQRQKQETHINGKISLEAACILFEKFYSISTICFVFHSLFLSLDALIYQSVDLSIVSNKIKFKKNYTIFIDIGSK